MAPPLHRPLGLTAAALAVTCTALFCTAAQAAQIQSITPSGSVSSDTAQVVVNLRQPAVVLGRPDAPAPVAIACEGVQVEGQGRWVNEKRWVFDFNTPLPGGVRCTVTADPSFRDLEDTPITGAKPHRFDTGGPIVERIRPYTWSSAIDEEQHFLLNTNGAVDLKTLSGKVWCQSADVGERIPVRLLDDQERATLLQSTGMDHADDYDADYEADDGEADTPEPGASAAADPRRYIALACQRRLTPGTDVQLVWGKGIASPAGVATDEPQRFSYTVRKPFEANFSCQREQADRKCIPVLPMRLQFNAPVEATQLPRIKLRAGGQEWPARAQSGDDYGYADGDFFDAAAVLADPASFEGRQIHSVVFEGPFPENTRMSLELDGALSDDAGRPLSNAASFPLAVATDRAPPLAKFPTGEFAVIERFAEGYHEPALLPVSLRAVEVPLPIQTLRLGADASDADIIEWMYRAEKYQPGRYVSRKQAGEDGIRKLPTFVPSDTRDRHESYLEARALSLLDGAGQVTQQTIPARKDNPDREATEVVGIPLEPGFQVVEIASPTLGEALLAPDYEGPRTLYARTAVLVTNLSVHFKLGAANSLAWVTSLDSGKPVAGATVRVNSCEGQQIAEATTDANGVARFDDIAGRPQCRRNGDYWHDRAYMVSARSPDGQDLGLVWTDWQRGIEPWRFQVPTDYALRGDSELAHTVFDRTLLRAGETVSMKHYVRLPVLAGIDGKSFGPDELLIRHNGSGQEFTQPLEWYKTSGGGLSADSSLQLPRLAPLGSYSVILRDNETSDDFYTGSFRVEEFRLPVFEGSVVPVGGQALVGVDQVDMNLQLGYVSGGGAANWPVQVSAMLEPLAVRFANYENYRFDPPARRDDTADEAPIQEQASRKLVMDKRPLKLDAQGNTRFSIDAKDRSGQPQNLRIEATFEDPNGEMQTITRVEPVWPAGVLVGLRTDYWISVDKPLAVQAVALTPDGKPAAGTQVSVRARSHTTLTTRKRMVGGFYKYEHQYESKDLGQVCSGKSDAAGRIECKVQLEEPGQIELIASASDDSGRNYAAATSVWVTRKGEVWFDGEASDRMDVLPEKPFYEPGETARFQVRMPYRKAQALVAVEREGIIETHLMELSGSDPSFTLKVGDQWSPNMYVSVLAVRGRLREVPWYSFFTWGFRSPRVWWQAWRNDTGEAVPPTALVDLSKPSYRFGVAAIKVGHASHRISVQVKADKARYATRDKAVLDIQATLPDGKPAAGAEVALAVVDKALLELAPNQSWDLLSAMMRERSWSVQTATAQMEVVGRRHYGRKAAPAGGGGGADGATRELFDTLLLWQPRVQLDAQGKARVEVPLNDSITTFHAEAVADAGVQFFGSGSAELKVAQDLQIISGLPPVVREGDVFDARFTIRNSTDAPFKATVEAAIQSGDVLAGGAAPALAPQTVEIAAGSAQTVQWRVTVPYLSQPEPEARQTWTLSARTEGGKVVAQDRIELPQTIVPAIPVTVRQASLRQLTEPLELQVGMPGDALEGRGGIHIDAQASLGGDLLPGLTRWWRYYPYACLEQRYGKAIGLMDTSLWKGVADDLPAYLDDDGLASYFPPRRGDDGSVFLTAHLLAADAALAALGETELRIDEGSRQRMIEALTAFAEGRLQREVFAPRNDLPIYKLMVIAALASHDAAEPRLLESIQITPQRWPTHAVLDWLQILKKLPKLPQHAQRLEEVQQELLSRILQTGAQVLFTTEKTDDWWWMMQNGDTNAARLLYLTADMPEWKDEMGGLASGLLARQRQGAWSTTTANLWGQLAVRQFARIHESVPVTGTLAATLGAEQQSADWPAQAAATGSDTASRPVNTSTDKLHLEFGWPDAIARLGDAENASRLAITQQGTGAPWVTISSLAAVPLKVPVHSGLRLEKSITPIQQAVPGQWSQGDIYRVRLVIHSNAQVGITALTDPIPSGSTILGGGLGRDSAIATEGEAQQRGYAIAWEERKMDMMRVYYYAIWPGTTQYEYTVRLNQPGEFSLPATRVEAMYMPHVFGEVPNDAIHIGPLPQ